MLNPRLATIIYKGFFRKKRERGLTRKEGKRKESFNYGTGKKNVTKF